MEEEGRNTCIRGCCFSDLIPLSIPKSSLTLLSEIARGAESVVYEATLDGVSVAAKKPRLSTSDDLDRYHKELQLLSNLDHPNIVKLVAAHSRPPDYMLLFQLYKNGNLSQALHVFEWRPSMEQTLNICLQLASAFSYLHQKGILHRDVKPANVLLNDNWEAHLADFGLAVSANDCKVSGYRYWKAFGKPTGGFHKKNMVGTLLYMAPEILRNEVHSEKSDVYGFGITINELVTGVVPYTDRKAVAQAHTILEMSYTEQQLAAAVTSGLRPVLATTENDIPPDLLSLIECCWHGDLMLRPSFGEIEQRLQDIISVYMPVTESHFNKENFKIESLQCPVLFSQGCLQSRIVEVDWSVQGADCGQTDCCNLELNESKWLALPSVPPEYVPTLSWGVFATLGGRETMEDTSILLPQLGGVTCVHLFGVFDGHRGSEAAEFAAHAIPHHLIAKSWSLSPSEALVAAYIETDIAFRHALDIQRHWRKEGGRDWHPGCTAVTALLVNDLLFVANAGDCRAVLCRESQAIALSKDHTASCVLERERVVRSGGHVEWQVDAWRVGNVALQVTRSIGDDDLKPAVTAEPEVTAMKLSASDEFLIIASDGMWDKVSNEEAISLIQDTVKEPSLSSKRLATVALERGSMDNITVIIVFLRPISTLERVY